MAEFIVRPASLADTHLLASIERAADQRYIDSPERDSPDGSAIPDEAAQRYCREGRILVAEVDDRVVGKIGSGCSSTSSHCTVALPTRAVVRIGDEVRRPSNPHSPTIRRLLRHLRRRVG